jgi:hypothetical protein
MSDTHGGASTPIDAVPSSVGTGLILDTALAHAASAMGVGPDSTHALQIEMVARSRVAAGMAGAWPTADRLYSASRTGTSVLGRGRSSR